MTLKAEPPNLRSLLDQSNAAVDEACDLVLQMIGKPLESWDKDDHSPVTTIDLAVDRLLSQSLGSLDPGAAWLSEETADRADRLDTDRVWVVDPIDGTRALLHGQPEFCISVALVDRSQRPVLGIVANPSTGQRFGAIQGQGAWDRSGQRLTVAAAPVGGTIRLLVSRSEYSLGMWRDLGQDMTVEPCSGLAWKMARIASGEADATVTPWRRSEWDAAAGDLIVAEAGGVTTDLAGLPLDYNKRKPTFRGVVCASEATSGTIRALADQLEERREQLSTLWRRRR